MLIMFTQIVTEENKLFDPFARHTDIPCDRQLSSILIHVHNTYTDWFPHIYIIKEMGSKHAQKDSSSDSLSVLALVSLSNSSPS